MGLLNQPREYVLFYLVGICSLETVEATDNLVWGRSGISKLASKNKSPKSCWALFLTMVSIWPGVEFATAIKHYVYFKGDDC